MSSYNTFAQFYDSLTENVDYKVRSDYISNFFSEYGNGGNTVLDLACGTGTLTKLLVEKGYNTVGLDLSEDMLTVAKCKCPENYFYLADMTSFLLPLKVDYCICSLDAVNHLIDYNQVISCFKCVNQSLKNDGIFIFDVNTPYKHRKILADNTFVFDEEDFFLSWDNHYIGDDVVEIFLDFFVYNGQSYDRFSESFKEKAYSDKKLTDALLDSGFEIIGIFDDLTANVPKCNSERLYFVCKKVK